MVSREFSRAERVAGELRRELARLVQREIKDPAVGFVSISDVEVSRDLSFAKVYVTVFEAEHARTSIRALNRAAGFLRKRLGQEMRIRSVPELSFRHDDSVETGQRMDRLIEKAVAADQSADLAVKGTTAAPEPDDDMTPGRRTDETED